MARTTPWQGLPVMDDNDDPNVPEDVYNLALAVERRSVAVYASEADRNTKTASGKTHGNIAYTQNNKKWWIYDGGWQLLNISTTPLPKITSSSSAPAGGSDGDIHYRY